MEGFIEVDELGEKKLVKVSKIWDYVRSREDLGFDVYWIVDSPILTVEEPKTFPL